MLADDRGCADQKFISLGQNAWGYSSETLDTAAGQVPGKAVLTYVLLCINSIPRQAVGLFFCSLQQAFQFPTPALLLFRAA